MAGLCDDGNELAGFLKVICNEQKCVELSLQLGDVKASSNVSNVDKPPCGINASVSPQLRDVKVSANVSNIDEPFDISASIYDGPYKPISFFSLLFNDTVSSTRLFSVDEIGDSEMVFGEMRPRIRRRLPGIHLTVGENLGQNPTRHLRWAGHVARMGESRNAYRVLVGRPEGKIPLERPRNRWEDNIKIDLREVRYDRDWINLAQDRDRWRAYVSAAMKLWVP
ncbi:hypothetical protein ANN_13296 [Periplaneta americana]|uniref:Uncharacterized protein n=1 Tax=Periplaneta americana TaxID=6978 RepID=A0ABQ8TL37_PERAM|nr:hypothetical protein ANN_13296 [Periplaneta americana]